MTSPRRRAASRRKDKQTGSPGIGEPEFVLVGILRRPHGLRGEALVGIATDFPERLQKGRTLFLGEEHKPVTIRSRRQGPGGLLLAFEEFPSPESLAPVRNEPLFARATDSPQLPAGKIYQHQLIGMDVVTDDGLALGKITEVMTTGANDVYIVQGEDGEILLPSIDTVVREIDLQAKRMTVHLIPGLLNE